MAEKMYRVYAARIGNLQGRTGDDDCSAAPSGRLHFEKGLASLQVNEVIFTKMVAFAKAATRPYGTHYVFLDGPPVDPAKRKMLDRVSTMAFDLPSKRSKVPDLPGTPMNFQDPSASKESALIAGSVPAATTKTDVLTPVPPEFLSLSEVKDLGITPKKLTNIMQSTPIRTFTRTVEGQEETYFHREDLAPLVPAK